MATGVDNPLPFLFALKPLWLDEQCLDGNINLLYHHACHVLHVLANLGLELLHQGRDMLAVADDYIAANDDAGRLEAYLPISLVHMLDPG